MTLEITCTRNEADHKQLSRCREALAKSSNSIERMVKLLSIAGSEVRLKILFLLDTEGELCPCDIADILEMSVPAISQQIRKIKDAGIIASRREGQTLYYSIIKNGTEILDNVFASMEANRKTA